MINNPKVDELVIGEHGGDAVAAIMYIAHRYDVAVACLTRGDFAKWVTEQRGDDSPLTDDEWATIGGNLNEYSTFVWESEGPTGGRTPRAFIRYLLHRNNIEPPAADEPWLEEN